MSCARILAAVSGYEQEFSDRVRVRTIQNDTEEGQRSKEQYGFQSHGILLFSPDGELIYKRRDHMVRADEVHTLLVNELAGRKPTSTAGDLRPVR